VLALAQELQTSFAAPLRHLQQQLRRAEREVMSHRQHAGGTDSQELLSVESQLGSLEARLAALSSRRDELVSRRTTMLSEMQKIGERCASGGAWPSARCMGPMVALALMMRRMRAGAGCWPWISRS
jgi:chromosome segregation ATPase